MNHVDPLVIDGHRYNGFAVIPMADRNAGLSVLMTYALNGVRNAVLKNLVPVVYFSGKMLRNFYDPERGNNVWEYYWEPVMGVSYKSLQMMLSCGEISSRDIHVFTAQQIAYWHGRDPERIATFWWGKQPKDPRTWMIERRELGRTFVAKYIRVKRDIQVKADDYARAHFGQQFHFGVHIRGTDLFYAEPIGPKMYFEAIDRLVKERQLDDYRVFLATDQEQFVDQFADRFGERLVTYDSIRSRTDTAPFKLHHVDAFKKGEDVLIDILLLARCSHVLKCAASVGEYALWFNPKIEFTDFSCYSKFISRRYIYADSAFRKLNVANEGALGLKIRRVRRIMENYAEKFIFNFDPRAWQHPGVALRYVFRFLLRQIRQWRR